MTLLFGKSKQIHLVQPEFIMNLQAIILKCYHKKQQHHTSNVTFTTLNKGLKISFLLQSHVYKATLDYTSRLYQSDLW